MANKGERDQRRVIGGSHSRDAVQSGKEENSGSWRRVAGHRAVHWEKQVNIVIHI